MFVFVSSYYVGFLRFSASDASYSFLASALYFFRLFPHGRRVNKIIGYDFVKELNFSKGFLLTLVPYDFFSTARLLPSSAAPLLV